MAGRCRAKMQISIIIQKLDGRQRDKERRRRGSPAQNCTEAKIVAANHIGDERASRASLSPESGGRSLALVAPTTDQAATDKVGVDGFLATNSFTEGALLQRLSGRSRSLVSAAGLEESVGGSLLAGASPRRKRDTGLRGGAAAGFGESLGLV